MFLARSGPWISAGATHRESDMVEDDSDEVSKLLLILMFIGFAGGFISVMRISNKPRGNPDGQK
jgi:hypothetical protein